MATFQGSSPYLQGGSSIGLQGSSPTLQSAPIQIQGSGTSQGIRIASPAGPSKPSTTVDPSVVAIQKLLASIRAQNATLMTAAPTPNFEAINANAAARASADVNPIYTKRLNEFLTQQSKQQATQQAIKEQNIAEAQLLLKNTQEANKVTGKRTTEDTATKQAQAAEQTDWRQTDQGGQYDMDRIALAVNQARSGTAGSGVAAGQQASSQEKFNTAESRQATQDAQTKAATELAKARTFEDLATSGRLAGEKETATKKAAEFNLSTFIQQQGIDLQNKQQQLESQRQEQVASVKREFVKSGFQDFFNKISNPAQKAAFAKAYGSYL